MTNTFPTHTTGQETSSVYTLTLSGKITSYAKLVSRQVHGLFQSVTNLLCYLRHKPWSLGLVKLHEKTKIKTWYISEKLIWPCCYKLFCIPLFVMMLWTSAVTKQNTQTDPHRLYTQHYFMYQSNGILNCLFALSIVFHCLLSCSVCTRLYICTLYE